MTSGSVTTHVAFSSCASPIAMGELGEGNLVGASTLQAPGPYGYKHENRFTSSRGKEKLLTPSTDIHPPTASAFPPLLSHLLPWGTAAPL